jgi:PAS domain-containing protein
MIEDAEFEELKEQSDKKIEINAEMYDRKALEKTAKEAKEKLKSVTESTDLQALETDIIQAEQKLKFAAKYASDELVRKNFKTLQSIIDDEPEYAIYESANGAKSVRVSGTDNKDRLTAINTFLRFNLKKPEDGNAKGGQHVHLHGSEMDNLIKNLLRGKE